MFCLLAIQDNRGGNVMHEIPTTIFSEKNSRWGPVESSISKVKQSNEIANLQYTSSAR